MSLAFMGLHERIQLFVSMPRRSLITKSMKHRSPGFLVRVCKLRMLIILVAGRIIRY